MAVAVDSSTPIRWAGTPGDNVDITSASFTAPANAFLVVCVEADGDTSGNPLGISVSDSGTLTWTEQVRRGSDETTLGGYSGIWTARTTSAVSRTVGARRTTAGRGSTNRISAKCYVLTGVDVDGTPVDTVGANNEGGSTTNNLTTSSVTPGANGLLIVADCDWQALGSFEASSDLTQDTTTYAGQISVCDGYKTCSSGVGVTANLNAAGTGTPQHKWCQIVVRESGGAPPSGLSYVGGNSNIGTGATISVSLTALTGGSGSSAAAGDIVVVFWGWAANANITPTLTENSGTYTYAFATQRANDTRDAVMRAAYKVMDGTPDSSCVVDGPNNGAYGGFAVVQVWRGQDGTPLTGTASGTNGLNSNHGNPPAITPDVDDAVIICGMAGSGATTATGTKTGPANYTTYEVKTKADGTGADCYGSINARLLVGGSGVSQDPAAYSGGSTTTSDGWCAGTLAIRPLQPVTGTLTQTLGTLTRTVAAALVALAGAATTTLGPVTSTAAATVPITASSSQPLGALTLSGSASVASAGVTGNLTAGLGAVTASTAANVSVAGVGTNTLGALTGASAGAVAVTGAGTNALGVLTATAVGNVAVSGVGTNALGALTETGSASVVWPGVNGTLSINLGVVTVASGAVVPVSSAGTNVLGALTSATDAKIAVSGAGSNPLGVLTGAATGTTTTAAIGTLAMSLGALTASASATVPVTAAGAGTLEPVNTGGEPVIVTRSYATMRVYG